MKPQADRHGDAKGSGLEAKHCAVCGRTFTWRRKWARDWRAVRYCSEQCRRRGLRAEDAALERAILELLGERGAGKSICPSEAAMRVAAERPPRQLGRPGAHSPRDGGDEALWRALMEPARMAGRRLAARGELEWLQRGMVVDPDHARGPVRFRRKA